MICGGRCGDDHVGRAARVEHLDEFRAGAERIPLALHDEYGHPGAEQFGQSAGRFVTRAAARRLQRKREREHATRADEVGSAACHARAAAAPADDKREVRSATARDPLAGERFAGSGYGCDEGDVELRGGGGRASAGDPVGLLDESHGHPGALRDRGHLQQIGSGDPAAGAVAEQQQSGCFTRRRRPRGMPGESRLADGSLDVQDDLISPKCRGLVVGASEVAPVRPDRPETLRFALPSAVTPAAIGCIPASGGGVEDHPEARASGDVEPDLFVDLDAATAADIGADIDADGYAVDVVAAMAAFDSSAESVAQARRLVERQLDDWGQSDLSDDARLVVSELLTNAALHAKPPIRLRLARLPTGVRLEVSDGSPEVPLKARAGSDVMTGRGWSLVEALCDSWGVQPAGHGKVVWATLLPPSGDASEIPAVFDSHTVDTDLMNLGQSSRLDKDAIRYEVTLGDVPTELLLAAKAHIDSLIREFALLASGAAGGAISPVPRELMSLIERVVGNFSEARQSIKKQALRAAERGEPRTQLTLHLPLSAADAGLAYLDALDEVDAYCRNEHMLTLESPPAHRLFRSWYVEELVEGLQRAADLQSADQEWVPETFESRLLREYQRISAD